MVSLGVQSAARRPARAAGQTDLYPLFWPLVAVGAVAAALALGTQGVYVALAMFTLFALVGAVWRMDMLPILPACIAVQWLSASSCYLFFRNYGRVPGGGYAGGLPNALVFSMLGLGAVVAGMKIGLGLFRKTILPKTMAEPTAYDIRRVFLLTLAAFAVSYVLDVVPAQLWFGGAQIISNLLELRFVPYFLLLVAVFEQRRGYTYAALGTAWVIGPQLLTGFSSFKEIMLVIIIAALAQWRPWVRTREQQVQNRRILTFGAIGAVAILAAALVWSGGVKDQWRQVVWNQNVQASPFKKMTMFGDVVGRVLSNFNMSRAAETLAARSSSGELYFSYVVTRVPRSLPHEDGRIAMRALENATVPRFLFPNKANLGGDTWLVRRYAGIAAAGNETGASIGLGYLAEFYIDFGLAGILVLGCLWGLVVAASIALLARASPSREVFLAAAVGMLTQYFMQFDGSLIKLLAGLIQHTLVSAVAIAAIGPLVQRWTAAAPSPAPSGVGRAQWRSARKA